MLTEKAQNAANPLYPLDLQPCTPTPEQIREHNEIQAEEDFDYYIKNTSDSKVRLTYVKQEISQMKHVLSRLEAVINYWEEQDYKKCPF